MYTLCYIKSKFRYWIHRLVVCSGRINWRWLVRIIEMHGGQATLEEKSSTNQGKKKVGEPSYSKVLCSE